MSASNRSLARLPLSIFSNLQQMNDSDGLATSSSQRDLPLHQQQSYEQEQELRATQEEKLPQHKYKSSPLSATQLRAEICSKLNQNSVSSHDTSSNLNHPKLEITTVGQVLKLAPLALLRTLDPLLTYVECTEFISRICLIVSAQSLNALELLHQTSPIQDDDDNNTDKDTTSSSSHHPSTCIPNHQNCQYYRHIPTFLPQLDQALLGGVRVGTITELVGRAGVGKTQLGLQLCIAAAHYKRGSIYIDTEQKLSVVRLQEMTRERWFQRATTATNTTHHNNGGGGESTRTGSRNHVVVMEDCLESVQRVLENVSVHQPQSSSELLEVLSNVDEEISLAMQNSAPATNNNDHGRGSPTSGTSIKYPIQLMILDSIAAPLQREFTSGTAAQRASTLLQMAQILKRIAQEWNIAIVVINQVGSTQIDDSNLDSEGNSTKIDGRNGGKDGVFSTAALGTAWHHCVSTRLLLEHAQDPHRVDSINDQVRQQYEIENEAQGLERGKVRTATIVKSNVVAKHVIEFQVNKMGITGTLP